MEKRCPNCGQMYTKFYSGVPVHTCAPDVPATLAPEDVERWLAED